MHQKSPLGQAQGCQQRPSASSWIFLNFSVERPFPNRRNFPKWLTQLLSQISMRWMWVPMALGRATWGRAGSVSVVFRVLSLLILWHSIQKLKCYLHSLLQLLCWVLFILPELPVSTIPVGSFVGHPFYIHFLLSFQCDHGWWVHIQWVNN